ncbi:hypothetical protein CR513_07080, partial [Mucuna pruriens]
MEMDLMKAQIKESKEATMARFLHDHNREIKDVVELQHYKNLSELVHQDIKVEMQIRRISASRKTYVGSSGWKGKEKKNDRARREKSPKKESESPIGRREFTPTLALMPLIGSESFVGEISTSNESKSLSDESYYECDLVVVRRLKLSSYQGGGKLLMGPDLLYKMIECVKKIQDSMRITQSRLR